MSPTTLHDRLGALLDSEPDLPDYAPLAMSRGSRRRRVRRGIEGASAAAVAGALALLLPVSPVNLALATGHDHPADVCSTTNLSVTYYDNALHVRNVGSRSCRFAGDHAVVLAVSIGSRDVTKGTGPHGEPTAHQTLTPGAVYVQPYALSQRAHCASTQTLAISLLTYASVEGRLFMLPLHLQDVLRCAQLKARAPHIDRHLPPPACTVFDPQATLNTWTLWVEFGNTEPCRLSGKYPISLVADPEATNIRLTAPGRAPTGLIPAHGALLQPYSVRPVGPGCTHGLHMVDVDARVENQLVRVNGPTPDQSGFFTCRIWTPLAPRIER